jgi:hypothetical protein
MYVRDVFLPLTRNGRTTWVIDPARHGVTTHGESESVECGGPPGPQPRQLDLCAREGCGVEGGGSFPTKFWGLLSNYQLVVPTLGSH